MTPPQPDSGVRGLALPLTYFLETPQGILLKNVGLAVLWPETLVLTLFAG